MLELVTVNTTDGVELDGAMYLPTAQLAAWRRPILAVHGLTWNFYRGPMRWLPPFFTAEGHPCLSLNMRDHDLDQPKDFELSHHDLHAGIDYLIRRFGATPIVVGHGYANNKIASYAAQSGDDRIRCNVLATLGSVKKYRPDIWDTVLRNAARMQGDVLVVQGAVDDLIEAGPRAAELVDAARSCRVEVVHLAGGNHYFHGKESELAHAILAWLSKLGDRP
jgi:alpha-beta hydrolase superfamily lysophospholipase